MENINQEKREKFMEIAENRVNNIINDFGVVIVGFASKGGQINGRKKNRKSPRKIDCIMSGVTP